MFNYVFFRLLRTRLDVVEDALENKKGFKLTRLFVKSIAFFKQSENYLVLFYIVFWFTCLFICYCTVVAITGIDAMPNGIPIIFAFFYFYYFIVASIKKSAFVLRKISKNKEKPIPIKYALLGFAVLVLTVVSVCFEGETRLHELDIEDQKKSIGESVFLDSIVAKKQDTMFFIAAHGGGLKANVWTLKVLNLLQEKSNGKLLNQTIAMSGASGGSLGLGLYSALYDKHGTNTTLINKRLKEVAEGNFVSPDIVFTMGIDAWRRIWPFNKRFFVRDRSYYSMVKYQNSIENTPENNKLSKIPFRSYIKHKASVFPSLIMNSSSTKGKRGILWSIKQDNFGAVFPFAENLADISNGESKLQTLPFYQALSTTNRFPVLSPAAKIKGYGHYIDAGAIDNSGLLGCLDVYNYLLNGVPEKKVLEGKKIVFIEILNGKSLYIAKVLKEINAKHMYIDEEENDNIIVDIKAGLNLDKIPGYLAAFFKNKASVDASLFEFKQLYMPFKISRDDIEKHLGGELDDVYFEKIKTEIDKNNAEIDNITKDAHCSWIKSWDTYDPVLSRHLSKSTIRYMDLMLKEHRGLKSEIDTLTSPFNEKNNNN